MNTLVAALALVCAVKKHPLHLVSSDAFSKEILDHMRLLGAKLTIVPSDNGKQMEKLTKDMIREAHAIADKTGAYITAQMENKDQLQAYTKLADEIWEQTGGQIDMTRARLRVLFRLQRTIWNITVIRLHESSSNLLLRSCW